MARLHVACAHCAAQIVDSGRGRPRKFCSTACREQAYRAAKGVIRRWADGMPACRIEHSCLYCDGTFRPKRAGRTRFCCRACAFAWKTAVAALTKPAVFRVYRRPRAEESPAAVKRIRRCPDCGAGPIETRAHRCDECRATRFDQARRRAIAAGRQRRREDGTKAAERKARKLKMRGVAVEAVNPIVVLDRDKWTCQLCGTKTPKRLRGTYESRAPEIDHIVPISQGGEHSYSNVQCACRACNLSKSGRPLGQMRLFG